MFEYYYLDEDRNVIGCDYDIYIEKRAAHHQKTGCKTYWIGKHEDAEVTVSTVFLWVDYGVFASQRPILFETMIFGGPRAPYQERYCTYDEAVAGHARAVELCHKPVEESEE